MVDDNPARPLPIIARLPPEIYSAILDCVDPEELQTTSLALTRALPSSPVPLNHLFRFINLTTTSRIYKLYRRLTDNPQSAGEIKWIQELTITGWGIDADVLNNLLHLVPNTHRLHIHVGTTFAPEHLNELLEVPRPALEHLSLRFRPYVEKATYYQFLKGSYFDGMLERISEWPQNPKFQHLSIVQDPLSHRVPDSDSESAILRSARNKNGSMAFAQPIVFFSIDPVSILASSPAVHHIRHVRFRVPSRTILHTLCVPRAFPSLTFLDISTSFVNESQVIHTILARFPRLEHLIVDGSGLCGNGKERDGWRELGKTCALVGVKRSREREREVSAAIHKGLDATAPPVSPSAAHAQTSHAASQEVMLPELGVPVRRSRRPRSMAMPTFSIRGPHAPALSSSTTTPPSRIPVRLEGDGSQEIIPTLRKTAIRILPNPVHLKTLSAASSSNYSQPTQDQLDEWKQEFRGGWQEGLMRLKETWSRISLSAEDPNVRLLRFDDGNHSALGEPTAISGLMDVKNGTLEQMLWEGWDDPPILCFGLEEEELHPGAFGPKNQDAHFRTLIPHTLGCGHEESRRIWGKLA